eukprot:IDg23683t1
MALLEDYMLYSQSMRLLGLALSRSIRTASSRDAFRASSRASRFLRSAVCFRIDSVILVRHCLRTSPIQEDTKGEKICEIGDGGVMARAIVDATASGLFSREYCCEIGVYSHLSSREHRSSVRIGSFADQRALSYRITAGMRLTCSVKRTPHKQRKHIMFFENLRVFHQSLGLFTVTHANSPCEVNELLFLSSQMSCDIYRSGRPHYVALLQVSQHRRLQYEKLHCQMPMRDSGLSQSVAAVGNLKVELRDYASTVEKNTTVVTTLIVNSLRFRSCVWLKKIDRKPYHIIGKTDRINEHLPRLRTFKRNHA